MSMNRLITSSSPQISYIVSFSISLSSAVLELSADGHERKCSNNYSIFVQAMTHSHKKLNVVYVFFSNSFVLYSWARLFKTPIKLTSD